MAAKKPTKKVGRPKLTAAQKKKNAASRKHTARPSQATGRKPSTRLKKRRSSNKVAGYFPNPIKRFIYAIRETAPNRKYYFDGVNLDTVKANAVHVPTNRLKAVAAMIAKKLGDGWKIYADETKKQKGARKKNPVPPSSAVKNKLDKAAKLYEDFTGHNADVIEDVTIDPLSVGLKIGKCDGILYTTKRDNKVEHYIHEFKRAARPTLIASHDGQQLGLIGGDFEFTERGITDN